MGKTEPLDRFGRSGSRESQCPLPGGAQGGFKAFEFPLLTSWRSWGSDYQEGSWA